MSSRSLSRMFLVIATVALTLSLTAGGLAQDKQDPAGARQAAAASPGAPVVITSAGRPVREETLPPETRAQVQRVRKAAESLAGEPGTSARIKVTVECSYPPLKCTITIQF